MLTIGSLFRKCIVCFRNQIILFVTGLRHSSGKVRMRHLVNLCGFTAVHMYQLTHLALLPLLFLFD